MHLRQASPIEIHAYRLHQSDNQLYLILANSALFTDGARAMRLSIKQSVVAFLLSIACAGVFLSDADAKVITISFYMKGITENKTGHPHCNPTDPLSNCIYNLPDHEISGYFILNDKNNDGVITRHEWLEYNVMGAWFFERGFLPPDFDPTRDDYSLIPGYLDIVDLRYWEILDEFGKPTGKLTAAGTIERGLWRLSRFEFFENGKPRHLAADSGINTNRTSGYPESSYIYPSFTWSTVRSGIDTVPPPPPPVPLPAAAWFFITALGSMFGLRYFKKRET